MPSRTAQSIRDQFAFGLVLAGLIVSFAFLVLEPHRWRTGTGLIAGTALLAAILRFVLPGAWIGLLAARGRWTDTVVYLALGGLILAVDLRLHG